MISANRFKRAKRYLLSVFHEGGSNYAVLTMVGLHDKAISKVQVYTPADSQRLRDVIYNALWENSCLRDWTMEYYIDRMTKGETVMISDGGGVEHATTFASDYGFLTSRHSDIEATYSDFFG